MNTVKMFFNQIQVQKKMLSGFLQQIDVEDLYLIRMKKVLVCEDDIGISEVVEMVLLEEGFEVETCENGSSVMSVWAEYSPDVVLLDLWLPGKSGEAICKELKMSESKQRSRVILFSANNQVKTVAERVGADDYLTKPFDIELLVTKVREAMKNSKN